MQEGTTQGLHKADNLQTPASIESTLTTFVSPTCLIPSINYSTIYHQLNNQLTVL